eukprot:CAMPEP_0197234588 /NCGR_PEP_ID=MMETSP1429-20130617/2300_1 /TAXON_ID=49237 /ORGANISM="Chaetoceros  sp., Strain UNC1202" /LENGTH=494 /DNA_ID=CAMNT_0042693033 /DNA_START=50 /DNA_END=1534 /DNA_ORIENTATION=-
MITDSSMTTITQLLQKLKTRQKYKKMIKMGVPLQAVRQAMVVNGDILKSASNKLENQKMRLEYRRILKAGIPRTAMITDTCSTISSHKSTTKGETDVRALLNKLNYWEQKYTRMLKMGVPCGAVKQAMTKDGVLSYLLESGRSDIRMQLKRSRSRHRRYSKMLQAGIPSAAVKQVMIRDGILPCEPNNFFTTADPSERINMDSKKYARMLRMGVPAGTIQQNMHLRCHLPVKTTATCTEKYNNMLRVGVPHAAVKQAMMRDSHSNLPPRPCPCPFATNTAKNARNGQKYKKTVKLGVADADVKQNMIKDSVLDAIRVHRFSKTAKFADKSVYVLFDQVENCQKYRKMLAFGIPPEAVKQAIVRDEALKNYNPCCQPYVNKSDKSDYVYDLLNEASLGKKHRRMLAVGVPAGAVKQAKLKDDIIPCQHSKYTDTVIDELLKVDGSKKCKYMKMLRAGVPVEAIEHAMIMNSDIVSSAMPNTLSCVFWWSADSITN